MVWFETNIPRLHGLILWSAPDLGLRTTHIPPQHTTTNHMNHTTESDNNDPLRRPSATTAIGNVPAEQLPSNDEGWECGKGCGFGGGWEACSVHEETCQFEEDEDEEEDELIIVRRSVSIGSERPPLVLEDPGDEIDLSAPAYAIGDAGCAELCTSLANNTSLSILALRPA